MPPDGVLALYTDLAIIFSVWSNDATSHSTRASNVSGRR